MGGPRDYVLGTGLRREMFAHQLGLPRIMGIIRCHCLDVAISGVVEGVRGPVQIDRHRRRAALADLRLAHCPSLGHAGKIRDAGP